MPPFVNAASGMQRGLVSLLAAVVVRGLDPRHEEVAVAAGRTNSPVGPGSVFQFRMISKASGLTAGTDHVPTSFGGSIAICSPVACHRGL